MRRLALLGLACMALLALLALSYSYESASAAPLSSAGCGASAGVPAGRSVTQTLDVNGTTRTYLLHLPTTYKPSVAHALVVVFHGHGNGAASFEAKSGFSRLANRLGFIVVYPQGATGPDGETGWNTGRAGVDPTTDDIGFTNALVRHLEATLCIQPARIYATGFSNGGGFTAFLACQSGSPFAAFAIMAGDYVSNPDGCAPGRAVPLLEMHGTGDEINPYAGSTTKGEESATAFLASWTALDGCESAPTARRLSRSITQFQWRCRGGVTILHDRLTGVGHDWPTGGRRNDYFNATSAAWAFLSGWR